MRTRYPTLLRSLTFFGAVLVLFVGAGCEKKDRLSTSTFSFTIDPPAATVVKGETQVLTAKGVAPDGPVETSPEWEASSTAGDLNTTIGPSVTLTGASLGDVTVTATWNGMQATSNIAIVTYEPGSGTFDVFSDAGLPTGTGITSSIFVAAGLTSAESTSGYTPEGTEYRTTTSANAGDWWQVTLDKNSDGSSKDLSSFTGGNLKFSLRLGRSLGAAEKMEVEVIDAGAPNITVTVDSDSFVGFDRTDGTNWQEISVPLALFFPGLDETKIKVPFTIKLGAGVASAVSFDVDAVRWEN